jgi:predicted NUDIX family phosphoesterase
LDELVFTIPTIELWSLLIYKEQGFINGSNDVLKKIVQKGQFRKRQELEEDPSFKQIIPYAIISNKEIDCNGNCEKQSFYLFKRTSNQTEKRLHNQLTLGVGGHMNPGKLVESEEQYVINELKRELFEEVNLLNECSIDSIEFIGFINDDTISVGKVHIGLLYNINLSDKDVRIRETDKMTAEWIEKQNLPAYYERLETWTKIIVDNYIN